ncbi:MAG: retropepsin-like aspartic protease [Xanthobacteraceae bacterium]
MPCFQPWGCQCDDAISLNGRRLIAHGQRAAIRIGSVYLTAMNEEDDPLARDGNWHLLSVSFDPRAMEQMGPNLEVGIAAVTEQGTTLAHHEVGALIDTGSKSSCISPRLALKMEGGLRGVRSLSHIYGLEGPPTIRGLVRFKNGVEFIRDFSVLDYLAPYDVLIGRDILREGRMYIDGGAGHFRLYFPKRTA